MVEFALIAPLLFLLLFGIIDFGRALDYYNQLTQLAGQGARAATVNRNPDGTALSTLNQYSIQQQLATKYTAQSELKKGIVVCILNPLPKNAADPVTVKVSYHFNFIPLVGAAIGKLGGVTLSATQTESAATPPVDANGQPTYAAGNQNQNMTGCS